MECKVNGVCANTDGDAADIKVIQVMATTHARSNVLVLALPRFQKCFTGTNQQEQSIAEQNRTITLSVAPLPVCVHDLRVSLAVRATPYIGGCTTQPLCNVALVRRWDYRINLTAS